MIRVLRFALDKLHGAGGTGALQYAGGDQAVWRGAT
jgi:hypothetical protein